VKNLTIKLVPAALLAAALAAACSAPANPSASAPAGAVVITANANVFAPASVTAPAGQAFQIWFNNLENVPHNVRVVDAAGTTMGEPGEIFNGPAARTQDVPALTAATYRLLCDVHPEMTAQLVAE
jgi:plastocyanin